MLSGKANKLSAILCGKILGFWKGAIDKEITIFCGSLASEVIKTTVLVLHWTIQTYLTHTWLITLCTAALKDVQGLDVSLTDDEALLFRILMWIHLTKPTAISLCLWTGLALQRPILGNQIITEPWRLHLLFLINRAVSRLKSPETF